MEVALELAGQPPLIPAQAPGIWPDPKRHACPVFRLPALSGSWGLCSEGLMHPHTQQVRPFVFDHNLANDPEKVVLVHLNHRLVQMCLRLLRAIPEEIEQETAAIRARFADPQPRMFPVAVTYLVPEKLR